MKVLLMMENTALGRLCSRRSYAEYLGNATYWFLLRVQKVVKDVRSVRLVYRDLDQLLLKYAEVNSCM